MKFTDLHDDDASEQWFSAASKRGSIHEVLQRKEYSVVGRQALQTEYPHLELPVEMTRLSFGAVVPRPLSNYRNAFLARYHFDLKSMEYGGERVDELLTRWMGLMPGDEQYLASLNPSEYLFAATERVRFEDVSGVARCWNLDCWIGVLDNSGKMLFVFDAEFGVTYLSFHPDCSPDGFDIFAQKSNAEFKEVFARDGKLRTGADQERIKEYYERVVAPGLP